MVLLSLTMDIVEYTDVVVVVRRTVGNDVFIVGIFHTQNKSVKKCLEKRFRQTLNIFPRFLLLSFF